MMKSIQAEIRAAAQSSEPLDSLREIVLRLSASGRSKTEIYGLFEGAMLAVREEHDGADSSEEDAIMDAMDLLAGFCSPHAALLPDEPLNTPSVE